MKQLLEFVPIALFFMSYQMNGETISLGDWVYTMDGIYSATLILMIATTLQVLGTALWERKLEKRGLWMLAAVLVFGTATVMLRNELFIQWKPTIFNWALGILFIGSQFIGKKTIMERTLGSQLQLPKRAWTTLNLVWACHFTLVGGLNIWVAYTFSEDAWVSYKLYSAIGFTLALTLLTAIIMTPYLKKETSAAAKQDQ
ncbi:MAG: septation protein IspZ [Halieaceae bacterium]|nr:septation protein IspZ [Halieaceae bacterium]